MKDPIEYHSNLINELNNSIINLLEQSDSQRKKDVLDLRTDIEYIRNRLSQSYSSDFPYKSIRIRFDEEYELKLPKYGLETFNRKLKGEMYFSVIGGTEKYIDIRTTSFPNTFKIRLYYQTLDILKRQTGKGYLIYKRGGEKLQGDETKIYYKIIKLL